MNKSSREKQAFINEFKGVLLEYTLAKEMAKGDSDLIFHECDFLETISTYQNYLMTIDLETFKSLPFVAKMMIKELEKKFGNQYTKVELAGKNHFSNWGEGDLLVDFKNRDPVLLSLKMIKDSSFINTKSGGAYSFFSKYFAAEDSQKKFAEDVSFSFEVFKKAFLKSFGRENPELSFLEMLKSLGISDRPGTLKGVEQEMLFAFYESCLNSLVTELKKLKKRDPVQFVAGVKKVCGFSKDITKVVFSYKNKENLRKDSKVFIESWDDYNIVSTDDLDFKEIKKSKSYVTLSSTKVDIQFRIKPMNSFATSGVKINVSVKAKN
tara:strand:- start:671 stop:1639 length:969 start_codon:yes stop_codon:yes gene_type:complete